MDSIRTLLPHEFPFLLRQVPQMPDKLYVRGRLPPADAIFLTVVGSRKHSEYGKEACETLIRGLKGLPVAIVSGLALGIDSIAHRAALESGLATVAVPGSGLDDASIYPASHLGLARDILAAGGALISPFAIGTAAQPWMFPRRNAIMAGMSQAVLVIEAEARSGTLITARHAADLSRDVLAVPGSIFSPGSAGPNALIGTGAIPISSARDLREALGFEAEAEEAPNSAPPDMSPDESTIFDIIADPLPREGLFALAARRGMDASRTNAALTLLEIKRLVAERSGLLSRA